MTITIKDVAQAAGVSPSTVSRVISDHPRISEETKNRVRGVMQELGYHPNLQARSLVVRSTETIGVVMPNSASKVLEDPFFPEVLRGISTKAREHQFGIYLSTGATEKEIYDEVVQMVQGRRVDGIILLYSRTDDKIMKYLLEKKFPFTVVGRPFENAERITFVDNDNTSITKQVTTHLIDLGHKEIAFLGANTEFVFTIDRLKGYKQALEEAQIAFNEDYIIPDAFLQDEQLAEEKMKQLLALPNRPTAFVIKDDFLAIQFISFFNSIGIRVPEDISMVGFNNITLCEYSHPPLTSVDIHIFRLGLEGANCLIEMLKNPDTLPKRITIPGQMIYRKSCQEKV
ncbi:LacI family DNA-binding transcriptional regulator [Virgibacillus soli]|uniref:LacI family DNA-binding transcriptional regulator n=1 Tax=Paracerasibacillus soli TaxID=480284 RepID=A0ABU5CRY2_9BACI|nr:LacI family DNA-binding transcriptional regulator [Virgibacillus soli]MDY0409123.1 LacI family DNA-binding transcriptional regulator [Virgibacillus soli]